jgi:hypothetical protein
MIEMKTKVVMEGRTKWSKQKRLPGATCRHMRTESSTGYGRVPGVHGHVDNEWSGDRTSGEGKPKQVGNCMKRRRQLRILQMNGK